jgi:hypothetical protein
MKPTLGRMVLYTFSKESAEAVNRRRAAARKYLGNHRAANNGVQLHWGNDVKEGTVAPATIVAVWGEKCVNLKVQLDGTDDFWATSVELGEGPHKWAWPVLAGKSAEVVVKVEQPQQDSKADAA